MISWRSGNKTSLAVIEGSSRLAIPTATPFATPTLVALLMSEDDIESGVAVFSKLTGEKPFSEEKTQSSLSGFASLLCLVQLRRPRDASFRVLTS